MIDINGTSNFEPENFDNSNLEKEIKTTENELTETNYKIDRVKREIISVYPEIKEIET